MADIKIGLNSLKSYIDEKVKEAVDDIKYGFIEIMVSEIMCLQTYKLFEGEDTVYIKRDDVLKIFEKYTSESEE